MLINVIHDKLNNSDVPDFLYDGDIIRDPRYNPWLICQYQTDDVGDHVQRGSSREFLTRKPFCVNKAGNAITVIVRNLGYVGSDLVFLDYRLIYCTAAGHRPDQGFTVPHFMENNFAPVDAMLTSTSVPGRGSAEFTIPYEPPNVMGQLANVYLRAKARYLFGEKPTLPEQWDPVADPTVVEAHLSP